MLTEVILAWAEFGGAYKLIKALCFLLHLQCGIFMHNICEILRK
jgi:hypothetical protein